MAVAEGCEWVAESIQNDLKLPDFPNFDSFAGIDAPIVPIPGLLPRWDKFPLGPQGSLLPVGGSDGGPWAVGLAGDAYGTRAPERGRQPSAAADVFGRDMANEPSGETFAHRTTSSAVAGLSGVLAGASLSVLLVLLARNCVLPRALLRSMPAHH